MVWTTNACPLMHIYVILILFWVCYIQTIWYRAQSTLGLCYSWMGLDLFNITGRKQHYMTYDRSDIIVWMDCLARAFAILWAAFRSAKWQRMFWMFLMANLNRSTGPGQTNRDQLALLRSFNRNVRGYSQTKTNFPFSCNLFRWTEAYPRTILKLCFGTAKMAAYANKPFVRLFVKTMELFMG